MRIFFTVTLLFIVGLVSAQTIFEETFDSLSTGLDLTQKGYELSKGTSYSGTVTAVVAESNGNKFARMVASPNGQANMRIVKSIDVTPGNIYTYEVESKGPFKRQLRVYNHKDEQIASTSDYKPSTSAEETAWKKMEVRFYVPDGVNKIKIGFHHYWSGTIDLDNYKVSKNEVNRLSAYYISNAGNDNNKGSKEAPFKSLEKISSTILFPGDSVFFKKGERFDGHFVVNGSGTEENQILISAYGEGEKPIITGQVGEAKGGDYQEAILVLNNDNLIFEGLEIQNERTNSTAGIADTDAYGINVINNSNKTMRNLVFRNLSFKNIFAVEPILNRDDFDKIQVSGLNFSSSKNTEAGKEKNIDGITVYDCYFGNLQRFGIKFGHSGGLAGVGNDSINRNMNIHIYNNEFYYNGGTGVLPNSTYNCLIENNVFDHPGASTDSRMPGRGSSIWNYNAINTIMQYNVCLSTRGYLDSHGIHIDNKNVNTFVQYNYMEDCEGGFVEILMDNVNAIYRFNVSVNDGWRKNEKWKDSNHTIWVNSDRWGGNDDFRFSDGVYIYNNTCVIDSAFTTSINLDGKNMFVFNNIWSSTNGAGMGVQNMVVRNNNTPFFMSNNLFEGNVDEGWIDFDAHPQFGNPMFNGTGSSQFAYQLQAGSPAINKGTSVTGPKVPGAGFGVFKNIPAFPNVDLFGNPVDLSSGTPNIGACNAKKGEVITNAGEVKFQKNEEMWLIFPRLTESKIQFHYSGKLPNEITVSLISLNGQILKSENQRLYSGQKEFEMGLTGSLRNGIYIVTIRGKGISHSRRLVLFNK